MGEGVKCLSSLSSPSSRRVAVVCLEREEGREGGREGGREEGREREREGGVDEQELSVRRSLNTRR